MTTPIYRLLPVVAAWWVVSKVTCANFDEYMTCGSGSERYGRHYHYNPNVPCDLSKESFCDSPGTQYPWSAVRRFVYENQGLMKRMYGNQRHYNVLRSELIHEMFEEMFEEMPKRQHTRYQPPLPSSSASSNSRTARYHKSSSVNALNSKNRAKSAEAPAVSGHQKSRSMKVTAEPEHGRPQMSSPSPKPKFQSKSPGIKLKTAPAVSSQASKGSYTPTGNPEIKVTRTNTRRPQATTNPSSVPITTSIEDSLTVPNENQWNFDKDIKANLDPTGDNLPSLEREMEEAMEESIHSTFFPPPSLDEMDLFEEDFWTTVEDMFTDTTTPYSTTYPESPDDTFSTTTQQDMTTPAPSTFPTDVLLDDPEGFEPYFKDFISSASDNEDDATTLSVGDSHTQDNKNGNPEQGDIGEEEGMTENDEIQNNEGELAMEEGELGEQEPELREVPVEGVVHKDVLEDFREQESQKDNVKNKRPIRGMNACPVKEEFIAPYWANNTRGETLALLNLYPFEQYVQWERCMYEHRQMYCRKGCRCEQQYRLQKLLAFDPTNECRGIFSDWFRFPSCCVCKCYDLPEDLLTVSARRPRYGMEGDYEYDSLDDEPDIQDLDDDEYDDDDYKDDDYEVNEEEDLAKEENEDADEDERQLYRVRSGVRLVNIPPQRRPRLPPRPPSHIPLPSRSLSPAEDQETASSSPAVASPITTTTLGTLDASTPHYFYNISHRALQYFAGSQPFPLSRIPRSNPEE